MSSVIRQVRYLQGDDKYICHRFLEMSCGHCYVATRSTPDLILANDTRYRTARLIRVSLDFAL